MEPRLSLSKASKGPFVSMIFQIIEASTLTIDISQNEADSKVSVTYPDLKILKKQKNPPVSFCARIIQNCFHVLYSVALSLIICGN